MRDGRFIGRKKAAGLCQTGCLKKARALVGATHTTIETHTECGHTRSFLRARFQALLGGCTQFTIVRDIGHPNEKLHSQLPKNPHLRTTGQITL